MCNWPGGDGQISAEHRAQISHQPFRRRRLRPVGVTGAVPDFFDSLAADGQRCRRAWKGYLNVKIGKLERAMRFELTTSTLARLRSTPELRPRHIALARQMIEDE